MTLNEAIKYLYVSASDAQKLDRDKQMRACELGIEALETVIRSRKIFPDVDVGFLPGETRE